MEPLTFSVSQLIIDDQKPKMSFFKRISNESFSYKETIYVISCEVINNRFFWIYAKHGNPLPYSDEVVDTNNSSIIKNLRKKEHAELNHQVFAIYDDVNDNFYTSKSKQKFLVPFLKEKLSKDIIIKKYYISPDEFIEKIENIGQISLTSKQNLFSQQSGLFEDVKDIFGLGQPENFRIDINYKYQSKTEAFKKFFKTFVEKRQNKEIDSLVCIGKDDKDMELIFDIKSYTKKIALNVTKNHLGVYNAEEVKNNIIQEIKIKKQEKNV